MGTDKITGLFFFLLSIYVCIESYRLGLGTFSKPEAGLFPFISGILLGVFSFMGLFDKMPLKRVFKDAGKAIRQWKVQKIVCTLVVLFAYTFLLKIVGFLLCTFLLVFCVYEVIEVRKIKNGILIAILSAGAAYFVFQIVIKAELPKGFLGI